MTVHPAIFLFAASGLVVWAPREARAPLLFCGSVAALVAAVLLSQCAHWSYTVGDFQLELLRVDALSHLFGVIFTLITVIGVLYAWHTVQRGEDREEVGSGKEPDPVDQRHQIPDPANR